MAEAWDYQIGVAYVSISLDHSRNIIYDFPRSNENNDGNSISPNNFHMYFDLAETSCAR